MYNIVISGLKLKNKNKVYDLNHRNKKPRKKTVYFTRFDSNYHFVNNCN